VEGEVRVSFQVGQPAALLGPWEAGDVDGAAEVVEDDLDAARLAALAPGGRDVDDAAGLLQRCLYIFVHAISSCFE
jgi:hypothetical protein